MLRYSFDEFSDLAARLLASIHSVPRPPTATNIPPLLRFPLHPAGSVTGALH